MSDDDNWGDAPIPQQRKGPPKWMLFVGCGCLVPGFLLVALVAWGMQFFGQATNPRLAYEELAQVLTYDEELKGTPTGLADDPGTRTLESYEDPEFRLDWGTEIPFSGGVAMFYFSRGVEIVDSEPRFADDALIAMITRVPTGQAGQVMEVRGPEGDPFTLDVQGRSLSGLRAKAISSDIIVEFPNGTIEVSGPGAWLTLLTQVAADPEDEDSELYDVLVMLQRPVEGGPPITDEEFLDFLAPFHVGPER